MNTKTLVSVWIGFIFIHLHIYIYMSFLFKGTSKKRFRNSSNIFPQGYSTLWVFVCVCVLVLQFQKVEG